MQPPISELKAIVSHIQKHGVKVGGDSNVQRHAWKTINVLKTVVRSGTADGSEMETSFILETADVYAWVTEKRFHITRGTVDHIRKIHSFLDHMK